MGKISKPIIYNSSGHGILACCPVCDSNVDWTYPTTILGLNVWKWKNGKRDQCIHCGCEIDWSDYREDIVHPF